MDNAEILKSIIVEIGMIKHALNQFNKLADFTGNSYEREQDELLDRLSFLEKKKEKLEAERKRKK